MKFVLVAVLVAVELDLVSASDCYIDFAVTLVAELAVAAVGEEAAVAVIVAVAAAVGVVAVAGR